MTNTTIPADGEAVPALATGIAASINGKQRTCEIRRKDLRFVTARLLPPADHRRDVVRPVFNDVVSDVS